MKHYLSIIALILSFITVKGELKGGDSWGDTRGDTRGDIRNGEQKSALVAGGAGFLGSHLCERLLKEGYEVVCLDSLLTGSLTNIEELLPNPSFHYINQDICNLWLEDQKFDEIYNLACPASPPKYQIDPIHTLKINFIGTLKLLELAERSNAIFLQASTSEIYGDPLEHPQKESYWGNVNPIGIRACYDEGKRVAETLCFEFYRQRQLAVKVVRIFNTYGPKMAADDGRVVSNFIMQALKAEPITLYGDGLQTRSFCYVDDLIEGFRKMMQTPKSVSGPINLGNPCEVTVKMLAEMIVEKTNSTSQLIYLPLPQDDPTKRKPDISQAEKQLLWEPKVSLDEGVDQTIQYFKVQPI